MEQNMWDRSMGERGEHGSIAWGTSLEPTNVDIVPVSSFVTCVTLTDYLDKTLIHLPVQPFYETSIQTQSSSINSNTLFCFLIGLLFDKDDYHLHRNLELVIRIPCKLNFTIFQIHLLTTPFGYWGSWFKN